MCTYFFISSLYLINRTSSLQDNVLDSTEPIQKQQWSSHHQHYSKITHGPRQAGRLVRSCLSCHVMHEGIFDFRYLWTHTTCTIGCAEVRRKNECLLIVRTCSIIVVTSMMNFRITLQLYDDHEIGIGTYIASSFHQKHFSVASARFSLNWYLDGSPKWNWTESMDYIAVFIFWDTNTYYF